MRLFLLAEDLAYFLAQPGSSRTLGYRSGTLFIIALSFQPLAPHGLQRDPDNFT
jgi:hypothetical protein